MKQCAIFLLCVGVWCFALAVRLAINSGNAGAVESGEDALLRVLTSPQRDDAVAAAAAAVAAEDYEAIYERLVESVQERLRAKSEDARTDFLHKVEAEMTRIRDRRRKESMDRLTVFAQQLANPSSS